MRKKNSILLMLGIDTDRLGLSMIGLPRYFKNYWSLKKQNDGLFPVKKLYPCLWDWHTGAGMFSGHYFYQDLLVASRIFQNEPDFHLDVGSRIDGFVAHVAAFRHIALIDIRPVREEIPNVTFIQGDITVPMNGKSLPRCDSLSCLHALEHFGLGRYGDPVDYSAHIKGFENMTHLLCPGGKMYISVPIGPQRIEFNAHRVFSVRYLVDLFCDNFIIDRFSYVDDRGRLYDGVELTDEMINTNCGSRYGCGIFEMTKKGE